MELVLGRFAFNFFKNSF